MPISFIRQLNIELDINHSKPAAPFYHQVRIVLYHTWQGYKEQLVMVALGLNLSCDSLWSIFNQQKSKIFILDS